MRIQSKLAWITATSLVLSVQGAGLAQSPPARGGGPAGPGATTKKVDAGPVLDLSKLVNREAAEARPVAGGLALPGAGAPIQSAAGVGSLQTLHGDATGAATTNAGRATAVVPTSDTHDVPSGAQAPHAEAVIRGQINPAAKSCYDSDPDSKSRQPGRLVILIKLTPAGVIDAVNVAINMGVSPSVATCITNAAHAATFAAPGANGTTVRAAFTFGKPEEFPPAGTRAKSPPAAMVSEKDTSRADAHATTGQTAHR
jgi:hypothetical protein